jgi:hypothetical protein
MCNNELYEIPTTEVVEVKIEGVVCQSADLNAALQDYENISVQDW